MESGEREFIIVQLKPLLIGQLLCENLFRVIPFSNIVMQNAAIIHYFWNILLSV